MTIPIYYVIALAFLGLILAWNLTPALLVWTLPDVPAKKKLEATLSILKAGWRGLLVIIPSFPLVSAPFVFLALLGTKREADALPSWAWWWENDVSIDGDRDTEVYWLPDWLMKIVPETYRGHRSFLARWWWLGLRNRASRLKQHLGYPYKDLAEYSDCEHWGTITDFGDCMEGWALNRRGAAWQIYLCKRLGSTRTFTMNSGFKVWQGAGDGREVANLANVTVSFPSWKGEA